MKDLLFFFGLFILPALYLIYICFTVFTKPKKKIKFNIAQIVVISLYLVVISMPNDLRRVLPKAHKSEAKIQLAGTHAALMISYDKYKMYLPCLKFLGYNVSTEKEYRRYAIGFKTIDIHPKALKKIEAIVNLKECLQQDQFWFPNGKGENVSYEMFPKDSYLRINEDLTSEFRIYAMAKFEGQIHTFSYDHNKNFKVHEKQEYKEDDMVVLARFATSQTAMIIYSVVIFISFISVLILFHKRTKEA